MALLPIFIRSHRQAGEWNLFISDEGKVHAISCTGANLEEDIFNMCAYGEYEIIPGYRDLTPQQELELRDKGFNRVTDTCIPETVMRHIEGNFMAVCAQLADAGQGMFPFQVFYRLFETKVLEKHFQIDPEHSWLMAKIVALLVYIGAGMVALRFGRSRNVRLGAWVFGLLTFLYIVSVALSKSVLGWFVYS